MFLKGQPVDEYLDALEKEMKLDLMHLHRQIELKSIFVGGGTPTALNVNQLESFVNLLEINYPLLKMSGIYI